jgi:hypothetical protein
MMTRTSSKKTVTPEYWQARLSSARAFRKAAEDAIVLAETGADANPVISQIVLSAIAYVDCLTAKRANVINQQDHSAASKLLRDILGAALPAAQENRLRRIVGNKDASQYGARPASMQQAQRLLEDLIEFANWVDGQL